MIKVKLRRHIDVSGNSGKGDVWEGVQFDNGRCAGRWCHKISSHGTYKNIESLIAIHGHNGNTVILTSDYGQLIKLIPKDSNLPYIHGYIFDCGMCVVQFMNDHDNIVFYNNIYELIYLYRQTYDLFKFRKSVRSDTIQSFDLKELDLLIA